MSSHLLFLSF